MSLLLAWTLLAFGGAYLWAALATAGGTVSLIAISRPAFRSSPSLRQLDAALLVLFLVACLYVIPLPAEFIAGISPNRHHVAAALSLSTSPGPRTLSINSDASMHALLVAASALAVFYSARGTFQFGGVRTVTRTVALLGLAASVVGFLQDASRTRLVYWWWAPLTEGAPGFGPFVNRNHFAGWVVMALPLTISYMAARTQPADDMDRFRSVAARLRRRLDFRTIWLMLAAGAMALALVLSLSRSGMVGALAALLTGRAIVAGRLRGQRSPRGWILGVAGALLALAILWTGPSRLADRWRGVEIGQQGRTLIWSETAPVVRDFWLTGTGVGTYGDAMTVYQRTDRERVHFNQAHNHYLQLVAEGGILLLFGVAVAGPLFVRAARYHLKADHTGMLWLRVGAAAGLAGLAISSIWETSARMPANAVLAAVLAAILLHDPRHHRPHSEAV